MNLSRLPAGRRFQLAEMPEVVGTLLKVTDGSALVEYDGAPEVCDFETIHHEWVRIVKSGKRRTTISKHVAVIPLR